MEKAYCDKCCREVDYKIESTNRRSKINGIVVSYTVSKARCINCGAEVLEQEMRKKDQEKIVEAYEKAIKERKVYFRRIWIGRKHNA